jgi:hypothetical protein
MLLQLCASGLWCEWKDRWLNRREIEQLSDARQKTWMLTEQVRRRLSQRRTKMAPAHDSEWRGRKAK